MLLTSYERTRSSYRSSSSSGWAANKPHLTWHIHRAFGMDTNSSPESMEFTACALHGIPPLSLLRSSLPPPPLPSLSSPCTHTLWSLNGTPIPLLSLSHFPKFYFFFFFLSPQIVHWERKTYRLTLLNQSKKVRHPVQSTVRSNLGQVSGKAHTPSMH